MQLNYVFRSSPKCTIHQQTNYRDFSFLCEQKYEAVIWRRASLKRVCDSCREDVIDLLLLERMHFLKHLTASVGWTAFVTRAYANV